MELVKTRIGSHDERERGDCWRVFVSKMIHKVEITSISPVDFSAEMTVRKHGGMACGAFWSKPHSLRWDRERASDAGGSGYLISWQLQGQAQIEHGNERIVQHAGSIAIADARRAMSVSFPQDVKRIVAKLPAHLVETRLPHLLTSHLEVFQPTGPFATTLLSYLTELSKEDTRVLPDDVDALMDNVANLLKVTMGRRDRPMEGSRQLRRQALRSYLLRRIGDPGLSLADAADTLHISRRLVQELLREMGTTFTQFITEERLRMTAQKLSSPSEVPISLIAYESGFNDISHFNHLFKRSYGMTPSQFRAERCQAETGSH